MKKKPDLLDRIDINPNILVGKPVIKGTRIPVYLMLELLSAGYDFKKILENYPQLKKTDIYAALKYAAEVLKKQKVYSIAITERSRLAEPSLESLLRKPKKVHISTEEFYRLRRRGW